MYKIRNRNEEYVQYANLAYVNSNLYGNYSANSVLRQIICLFHFSCKNTIEAIHGLMSQVIKDKLFNQIGITPKTS